MHRPTLILAFGLALLGAPAAAVPCGDDSCQEHEDRDEASIQLKPTPPRTHDASRILGDELSPAVRDKDARPPEIRDDGRAREWRKRIATLPEIPTHVTDRRSTPV